MVDSLEDRETAVAPQGPGLARLAAIYRAGTLGRRPTPTEMRLAQEFLEESPLSELCRALFNVNEFVYLD